MVTVIDLKKATRQVNNVRVIYGVYALFLKNGVNCSLKYGRRSYDYQEGSIVIFSPGQIIDVAMDNPEIKPDVIGLMFHLDLIYGTPLAEKTSRSPFLITPITRHKVNSDILASFERQLKDYFNGEQVKSGLPSVAYFADKLNLTSGYFSDLIRKETGTTPKELISRRVISEAKHRLSTGDADISEIAYALGFEYPAHFTRMFKRITGQNPTQYRSSLNPIQSDSLIHE